MFNPHARWDRALPGDDAGQWEPVEMVARFACGKVIPLYFIFGGRRFTVERLDYSWTERRGRSLVYYFNVSDTAGQYRLMLDSERMSWRFLPAT